MKFLVVGQGGREHALVKALSLDVSQNDLFATPGLTGFDQATCLQIPVTEIEGITEVALEKRIDTVIVGPEVPLALGLVDRLESVGIRAVGPRQVAAQLESSKIFAKRFMQAAGVPTAGYSVVESVAQTEEAARRTAPPYVLKADGLAAGKGVFIASTIEELKSAARLVFEEKVLGEAGKQALLEDFQPGWELSFLVLVAHERYQVLPLMQDHKRVFDGDKGPNTGGMGVVGPIDLNSELRTHVEVRIVQPTLKEMQRREFNYLGVLYFGLMITPNGPMVIEYNTRFGDPEAQSILPLLDGTWAEVFHGLARGKLEELKWKKDFVCTVVMAAKGYPDRPKKGVPISGNLSASGSQSYFLHAGTSFEKNHYVTHGGRVLNAVGLGGDLAGAVANAYGQLKNATWPGMHFRTDIGEKILGKKN